MTGNTNLVVRIAGAPVGLPTLADFEIQTAPIPEPGPGEVLFRSIYMSIDPSMRRKMPSRVAAPGPLGGQARIGDLMVAGQTPPLNGQNGGHVGLVIASNHPDFHPGDFVKGGTYWQTYHAVPGPLLVRLDPRETCLRDELGVMGSPGFVAYCGMELIAQVRPGETFVVSAAGGAIGMVAGQMAKIAGARVVGISSGEKCDYVVGELGFDACIDRNAEAIGPALDRECSDGIDCYFDNVGGGIQRACFARLRDFGRLVVCGMVSEYNAPESDHGPPLRPVLRKRLKIQGFVVYDHETALLPQFRARMAGWLRQGRMKYRNDIVEGLENAPEALIRLLKGLNQGKAIVRVSPDPTRND
jgi:NADPH-dependent curcumin reductase CurA